MEINLGVRGEDDTCGLRCCEQTEHRSEQNVDIPVKWRWEDNAALYRKISYIA